MAKKKSELEADRDEYRVRDQASRAAIAEARYADAVRIAASALPLIDGMMQYERKYEGRDFESVGAIDTVLRYAPLLLDEMVLGTVAAALDEYRRIERDTKADLGTGLDEARRRLWMNRRLLDLVMKEPGIRQDDLRQRLRGEQDYWLAAVHAWVGMGLLRREAYGTSYRLFMGTDLQQSVWAKCASCGSIAQRTREQWVGGGLCGNCCTESLFVRVDQSDSSKG